MDADSSNDDATAVATVEYPDLAITGTAWVVNRDCTGVNLGAFYECEQSPSSIMSHEIILESDGSITFAPGIVGYTGTWGQDTDEHLWFEYSYGTLTRLEFEGNAVSGSCFEGLSTFPDSPYVAPYEVCIK